MSQLTVDEQGIVGDVMAAVPAMPFAHLQTIALGLRKLPGAHRSDSFEDTQALRVVIWIEGSECILGSAEAFMDEETFRVHVVAIPDDVSFDLPRAVGERMCQLGRPGPEEPHEDVSAMPREPDPRPPRGSALYVPSPYALPAAEFDALDELYLAERDV
jgi:hypothetical protein